MRIRGRKDRVVGWPCYQDQVQDVVGKGLLVSLRLSWVTFRPVSVRLANVVSRADHCITCRYLAINLCRGCEEPMLRQLYTSCWSYRGISALAPQQLSRTLESCCCVLLSTSIGTTPPITRP